MSVYLLHGLRPWLFQRLSAIYILLFSVYIGYSFAAAGAINYGLWREWLFDPPNTIAVGLFVIALLIHAWVGIRDVILDYVHNTLIRVVAFTVVMLMLIASGLWSAKILLISVVI